MVLPTSRLDGTRPLSLGVFCLCILPGNCWGVMNPFSPTLSTFPSLPPCEGPADYQPVSWLNANVYSQWKGQGSGDRQGDFHQRLGHLPQPQGPGPACRQLDLSFLPVSGLVMNCSYFIPKGVLLPLQNGRINSKCFLGRSFPSKLEITIISMKTDSESESAFSFVLAMLVKKAAVV